MPMLMSITMLDGGAAAVSVTSTGPVALTGKLWKSLPPTATVPVKVSVVRGTVGVVVAGVVLLPHPATPKNSTRAAAA
jgi:hypothetical protein